MMMVETCTRYEQLLDIERHSVSHDGPGDESRRHEASMEEREPHKRTGFQFVGTTFCMIVVAVFVPAASATAASAQCHSECHGAGGAVVRVEMGGVAGTGYLPPRDTLPEPCSGPTLAIALASSPRTSAASAAHGRQCHNIIVSYTDRANTSHSLADCGRSLLDRYVLHHSSSCPPAPPIVTMCGPVAVELRMHGWGPHTREASVLLACCWYNGVTNTS